MRGDRVFVTKRAVSILFLSELMSGASGRSRKQPCSHKYYREFGKCYKETGLPSDQTLRAELIADRGFNPNAVDAFLKDFRASLAYAGISVQKGVALFEEGLEAANLHNEDEQLKPEGNNPRKAGNPDRSSENAQIQGVQRRP